MTSMKENKLQQIQDDLNIIKSEASKLEINKKNIKKTKESMTENNTILLTEVVDKKKEFNSNFSNSELIFKLKELQSNINEQQKIITELIDKTIEVK